MPWSELQAELAQREADNLMRHRRLVGGAQQPHLVVDGKEVLSFCSNDYLGLASHPGLVAALQSSAEHAGVGAGASHLITGHHQLHHQAEEMLAAFVRLPRALLFSTGYMANLGVVTALLGRHDAVFADRLNHASLNDAAVLSRAELQRFPHNDMDVLEKLLSTSQAKRKLVVVDAVFSMDGDLAPVPQLLELCERYNAWLMLDDAHGFGVLGDDGRGVLQHFGIAHPRIIYMATLGKAAGVFGAFVAGDARMIEYLLQKSRPYIYTTAMPPALCGALCAAVPLIEQGDARRQQLHTLVQTLKGRLKLARWRLDLSETPIQPLIIGSNEEALRVSECLLERGILVPTIRPPTVPQGTARLRISLSAAHEFQDVEQLVNALHDVEQSLSS
jgi:8-amino-7-oxononanoate synthase